MPYGTLSEELRHTKSKKHNNHPKKYIIAPKNTFLNNSKIKIKKNILLENLVFSKNLCLVLHRYLSILSHECLWNYLLFYNEHYEITFLPFQANNVDSKFVKSITVLFA